MGILKLKQKLDQKNKIVEFFQKGLLSEEEFKTKMDGLFRADELEKEIHNPSMIQDEQNEISWEENHGARQGEDGQWEV